MNYNNLKRQFTQSHRLADSSAAGHVVDSELNRRRAGPVDVEHSEMEVHANFSMSILVWLDIAPVAIQTACREIMQGITGGCFQDRQLAPVNVAGDEHNSIGLSCVDEVHKPDQFMREVGP